jgi:hypothetical protein
MHFKIYTGHIWVDIINIDEFDNDHDKKFNLPYANLFLQIQKAF